MIRTDTHKAIDFLAAAVFAIVPVISGLRDIQAARWVFWGVGAALLVYTFLTNHHATWRSAGARHRSGRRLHRITLNTHLFLDSFAGLFMIVAPYIFGYAANLTFGQFLFHNLLGLALLVFAASTAFDGTRTHNRAGRAPA